ncbi:MAG: hypothetical protein M1828_005430 [Chrysothrix sp. TS-e1954]|nr:MAG: hypothetical protein M1828_005430 [Chrysothrix sp. TS-e1954]
MAPPRMTANPVRPARYRPGNAVAEDKSSSEASDEEASDGDRRNEAERPPPRQRQPPPKASSFPANTTAKVAANLKNVDLNERKRRAELEERERVAYERREQEKRERDAGFVTESESGSGSEEDDEEEDEQNDALIQGSDYARPMQPTQRPPPEPKPAVPSPSGSDSASSSGSEEDTSSSDTSDSDAKPKHARPIFIPKSQRNPYTSSTFSTAPSEDQEVLLAARRQQQADALVQEHLERDAAAKAAGKKGWDDDAPDEGDYPDDTDDVDPELEHAQWVARELSRLKRSRAALEEREREIAEVERRRNMSASEREAEDKAHVEGQLEAKKERGTANVMQKYHHHGAFFQDDEEAQELKSRNLMGGAYQDQSTLAKEMFKVRDVTRIGKKGQTRHRDLKTDDTGRWGDFLQGRRRGDGFDVDERFRPDRGGGPGATGANSRPLGEKRTFQSESREGDAKRVRVS